VVCLGRCAAGTEEDPEHILCRMTLVLMLEETRLLFGECHVCVLDLPSG
jgi:hypothetical protein